MQDTLFEKPLKVQDFQFDESVASVFNDMLLRSIPCYEEIQNMVVSLGLDFASRKTGIYDLGCSTGNTLSKLLPFALENDVELIGIDSSLPMLDICQKNLGKISTKNWKLLEEDLNECPKITNASVVNMILTLQFIRPIQRLNLVKNIYDGLNKNGALILVEKVLGNDSLFNRLFIKHYYDLKKEKGYSELQISQKREALENVLIPYRLDENIQLLKEAGFSQIDVFFKWYNFCGLIAVK